MKKILFPAHILHTGFKRLHSVPAGCITRLKGLTGTAILLLINPGLTPWATNMASVS